MSENLDRGTRDFSKYDVMTTAELEEILRLDADLPEGAESDTELIFYIMGVLADRRNNSVNPGNTAFEAWKSFEENYMPREEEPATSAPKKYNIRYAMLLRRFAAAAAVVILLAGIPLTTHAFDLGALWNVVAHWAKETFSFVSDGDIQPTDPVAPGEEGFASLQDALNKSNRDPSIVPSWIPDNYSLDIVIKELNPGRESYIAMYCNDTDTLRIYVHAYLADAPEKIEVDLDLIETYSSHGVDYYILSNYEELQIVWTTDPYECNISGDISLEEAKRMIDSIGKE